MFDRGNSYDYAGRLAEAYSGVEARNFLNQVSNNPTTNTVPYRKTYTHNVWGDQTGGSGGYWSNVTTTTNTVAFTNGRRSGWQYDAAGNIIGDNTINNYTFDAASRNTLIRPQNFSAEFDITQEFDGDGQVVKWHHYNYDVGTFYYLRSSVLGGKIVTEIHGETNSYWAIGSKAKSYVYAGGDVLAEQRVAYPGSIKTVVWMHTDPAGSDASSQVGGVVSLEHEFDPMGADVGYSDPANTSPPYVPDPPVPTYTGGGNMGNPACTLDGVEYDCAALFNLLSHGSAAIAPPQTYVPVTANYSNGTSRRIGFAKWNSNNNSYEGTLWYQDQDERNRYLSLTWERGGQALFPVTPEPVHDPTDEELNGEVNRLNIKDTVSATSDRLNNSHSSCRLAIASSSYSALGNPKKLLEYWSTNNKINKDSTLKAIADTPGIRQDSKLRLSATFFNEANIKRELEDLLNVGKKRGDSNFISLTFQEARVLVFIHELGHGTGKYVHGTKPGIWFFGYDGVAPGNNIPELYEKCFKKKKDTDGVFF